MTDYVFTSYDYPGATSTYGYGINASGAFVGIEVEVSGTGYGYVDKAGVVTRLNFPDASTVELDGINAGGQLSGSYRDKQGGVHGFLADGANGPVKTIDFTGAAQTFGRGLNDSGVVAGSYVDSAGHEHAFTDKAGSFARFDYPGATETNGVAINQGGTLLGIYLGSNHDVHGFEESAGKFTSIDFPGASQTLVNGINNRGQIVGTYLLPNGSQHAFVFDGAKTYTSFDYAGGSNASANGINDAGQIVGTAVNAKGASVAFVATPVCFAAGSRIKTARGDLEVEALRVGDLAVTASGAMREIVWLGHRSIACGAHRRPADVMPIRIAAHAFGPGRPSRALRVSPGHGICVDALGEVLIPASSLINGTTVVQEEVATVTYWHVELGSHDVILAEDLPCESYLEMGNRRFFSEADAVALYASPDGPVATHDAFCRPFHADGPVVDFVRWRLEARAMKLGWKRLEAPFAGLHLLADGVRIDADLRDLSARFLLPAGVETVWLVSDSAVPRHIGVGSDLRRLGVCLGGLVVEDGFSAPRRIASDDPRLAAGFQDAEDGPQRWTAGRALLPRALWDGFDASFFLRIDLARPALPRWERVERTDATRAAA